MTRFFGVVGYGETTEVSPGIWSDIITEREYYGDITYTLRRLQDTSNLNDDLVTSNAISILADPYANENFVAIRYVIWAGTRWTVNTVEVQSPRLILRLGGVYNGPIPVVEPDSGGDTATPDPPTIS